VSPSVPPTHFWRSGLEDRRVLLEQVAASLPASIWTTDRRLVFTWGGGLGLVVPVEQFLGKTIVEFLGPEHDASESVKAHFAALEGENRDYELVWKDWVFAIHVAPLRDVEGRIVGALGFGVEVTARRKAEERLAKSEAELRRLAQRLQVVREEEQTRISREIHDQLGSMLSLFRIELARVRNRLSWRQADVRSSLDGLLESSAEMLATVRRVAAELRPPVLETVGDLGFKALLEFVAEDIHRRTRFPVHLDVEVDETRIDPGRAETAYHVVREALNNVIAHAGAVRAMVTCRTAADELVLQILDDGRGMHEPGSTTARGLGLVGIRERLRAWGGSMELMAEPGGGTRVECRLPLAPAGNGS
jgi:signal transduction histidine kinase